MVRKDTQGLGPKVPILCTILYCWPSPVTANREASLSVHFPCRLRRLAVRSRSCTRPRGGGPTPHRRGQGVEHGMALARPDTGGLQCRKTGQVRGSVPGETPAIWPGYAVFRLEPTCRAADRTGPLHHFRHFARIRRDRVRDQVI